MMKKSQRKDFKIVDYNGDEDTSLFCVFMCPDDIKELSVCFDSLIVLDDWIIPAFPSSQNVSGVVSLPDKVMKICGFNKDMHCQVKSYNSIYKRVYNLCVVTFTPIDGFQKGLLIKFIQSLPFLQYDRIYNWTPKRFSADIRIQFSIRAASSSNGCSLVKLGASVEYTFIVKEALQEEQVKSVCSKESYQIKRLLECYFNSENKTMLLPNRIIIREDYEDVIHSFEMACRSSDIPLIRIKATDVFDPLSSLPILRFNQIVKDARKQSPCVILIEQLEIFLGKADWVIGSLLDIKHIGHTGGGQQSVDEFAPWSG